MPSVLEEQAARDPPESHDRVQETFETIGDILQQPVIPEDQLVDRSLYTEAVAG